VGWLLASVRIIIGFASEHGTAAGLIAAAVCFILCLVVALIMSLSKFFENLPKITESIFKRRPDILERKKEIRATAAAAKVARINALTDREAMRRRAKDQTRVVRRVKIDNVTEATKMLNAIRGAPDPPEGSGNNTGTPPGGPPPPANVRRLKKPGGP
jgi:hypothetical protein